MSQWTHVTGCIRLSMSSYVENTNNEGEDVLTLKYPKEQCKIIRTRPHEDDEPTWVTMQVSSLPIAKRVINPLMKSIMPQGELGLTYFVNQRADDYGNFHNYFYNNSEKEIYEELCKKKFGSKYNDKDYKLDWVQNNCDFTLTIADDIRCCSGEELYNAFIELLKAFDLADIYIDSCAIEWEDEWCSGKLFRITQRSTGNRIVFEVRDIQKDKVEKFDVFKYDSDTAKLVKEEFLSLDNLGDEE